LDVYIINTEGKHEIERIVFNQLDYLKIFVNERFLAIGSIAYVWQSYRIDSGTESMNIS